MSTDDKQRGWLTRTLLPGGEEPDPRFTLANERTFLAWVRTERALRDDRPLSVPILALPLTLLVVLVCVAVVVIFA